MEASIYCMPIHRCMCMIIMVHYVLLLVHYFAPIVLVVLGCVRIFERCPILRPDERPKTSDYPDRVIAVCSEEHPRRSKNKDLEILYPRSLETLKVFSVTYKA